MTAEFTGDQINEMISKIQKYEAERSLLIQQLKEQTELIRKPIPLRMLLLHGRVDPEASPGDDWGFDGPTIEGIVYVHAVYRNQETVGFITQAQAEYAHRQTGWDFFDEKTLEIRYYDDLVVIDPPGQPSSKKFFGDKELQIISKE